MKNKPDDGCEEAKDAVRETRKVMQEAIEPGGLTDHEALNRIYGAIDNERVNEAVGEETEPKSAAENDNAADRKPANAAS